jgi:hypothetical protein
MISPVGWESEKNDNKVIDRDTGTADGKPDPLLSLLPQFM